MLNCKGQPDCWVLEMLNVETEYQWIFHRVFDLETTPFVRRQIYFSTPIPNHAWFTLFVLQGGSFSIIRVTEACDTSQGWMFPRFELKSRLEGCRVQGWINNLELHFHIEHQQISRFRKSNTHYCILSVQGSFRNDVQQAISNRQRQVKAEHVMENITSGLAVSFSFYEWINCDCEDTRDDQRHPQFLYNGNL